MYCPMTGKPCSMPKNIHVTESVKGALSQHFICQQCASHHLPEQHGSSPFSLPMAPKNNQLGPVDFLSGLMHKIREEYESEKAMREACPSCGMTLAQFIHSGRIGCPECYEFFYTLLAKLLEHLHEGADKHVGKRPKRGSLETMKNSLIVLRKKMDAAVKEERYEDAAKIRDQINAITAKLEE
jgi:protein arginine kinase activator